MKARAQRRSLLNSPPLHTSWLPPAVLTVFSLAVYSSSFGGEFVFDDSLNITGNPHLRTLWPLTHFLQESRPVVDLTLALNLRLGGLKTWGFHLVNVAVHVIAGLTLYAVARRALLSPRLERRFGGRATSVGFVIALLWMIHPLQTQGVTYIIQRAESMMAMFYLLTLYCVIRGATSLHPRTWAIAAIASCAAGMGSKAVMATAPFVVFLYDAVFLAGSPVAAIRRRWGLYLALLATGLVLFRVGVIAGIFGRDQFQPISVGFGLTAVTPWEYLRTQPGVILHYLRLCFWPSPLCLDYGWKVAQGFHQVFWPSLVIVALLAASIWSLWKRPAIGFLGIAFFAILAPTSSFIPIKDLAFEHRMYLPSAAVIALGVAGVDRLFSRRSAPIRQSLISLLRRGMVVAVAMVLGGTTFKRNSMYADPVELWSRNVALTPHHPRPHNAYAKALQNRGDFEGALRQYLRAIELDPNYAGAFANIGDLYIQQRNYPEALRHYQKALEISRYEFTADFHDRLGLTLLELGRPQEAVAALEEAVALDPQYATAFYNLGNAQLALGQSLKAVAAYEAALQKRPDWPEVYVNLGLARTSAGLSEGAIQAYLEGIRLGDLQNNRDVAFKARFNLGSLLLRFNRPREAAKLLEEALRLNPNHPGCLQALREATAQS